MTYAFGCVRLHPLRGCPLFVFDFVSRSLRNVYNQFLMSLSAYATGETLEEGKAIPSGKGFGLLWNILFSARVKFIYRTAAD